MSAESLTPIARVSLEDLADLNAEMAALARAGVPLELGLAELGRDMTGRPGQLARQIADELSHGHSLSEVVAGARSPLSRIYSAVVAAGIRTGRLAAALEATGAVCRRLVELRRTVLASLVYPLIILAVAYPMFVWGLAELLPKIDTAYQDSKLQMSPFFTGLMRLGESAAWWAAWPPAVLLLSLTAWWAASRRAGSGAHRAMALVPGGSKLIRQSRIAAFTDLLALQLAQQVPLPEAIELSAQACGDAALQTQARRITGQLQAAQRLDRSAATGPLPELLVWLIGGSAHGSLAEAVARLAEQYHLQATRRARWMAVAVPVMLTLGIGGTTVLVYALTLMVPWMTLMRRIGETI